MVDIPKSLLSGTEINNQQTVGQIWPHSSFAKSSFIETHTGPFVYILSIATSVLQYQKGVVVKRKLCTPQS